MIKANKNTRKILIAVVATILVAIAGFVIYDKVGYNLDKQKFIQLRKDMLSLQKEFNAIDTGWEYKEWCGSTREKLNPNQASYCASRLTNDTIKSLDKYINTFSDFKISQARENSSNGKIYLFNEVNYKSPFNCEMTTNKDTDNYISSTLRCASSSRYFFYEIDR